MPDQQTVEDLGKLVKSKYPGSYDSMADAEVGQKVKAKYPEYSQFADMPSGGTPGIVSSAIQQGSEMASGVKAAASQFLHGGGAVLGDAAKRYLPTGITRGLERMDPTGTIGTEKLNRPDIQAEMAPPDTGAGKVGFRAGQAAPYLIPTGGGPTLAGRMLASGLQTGVIATAQSGDIKEGGKAAVTGAIIPAAVEGAKALAPPIKALAEKIYKSALLRGGGGKADKVIAGDVAPELVKRGWTALTEGGLARKTQDALQEAGTEVGRVEDEIAKRTAWTAPRTPGKGPIAMVPPASLDFNAVTQDFQQIIKDKFLKSGQVPAGLEGEYNAYVNVLKHLKQRGSAPSFNDAIELRRAWDRTVAEAGGFQRPDLAATKEAMRDGANTIRAELSRAYPELAKANAEYSLWAGANQVIENTAARKAGHGFGVTSPMAGATGAIAETAMGGTPIEAATAGMALFTINQMLKSTAARTMEPVVIDRVGRLLQRGNYEDALRTLTMAIQSPGSRALPGPKRNDALQ